MTQSDAPDVYADPLPHAMKSLRAKSDEIERLKTVNAELMKALEYLAAECDQDMDDDYNPHAAPLALARAAIARAGT